ncbi:MAG: DUF5655 domain-containing protein [Pseudomonadales bacterium]
MANIDQALKTQVANIERLTGRTIAELREFIAARAPEKHGQIVSMLKTELGLTHGHANMLAHLYRQALADPGGAAASADPLDAIYTGPKAALRPIHDELMRAIAGFGAFESAPKKSYVSLRRSKQFATIGPATKTRVDLGLNLKGVAPTDRLRAEPPGRMCQYKVALHEPADVDEELLGWVRQAFDDAG